MLDFTRHCSCSTFAIPDADFTEISDLHLLLRDGQDEAVAISDFAIAPIELMSTQRNCGLACSAFN